MEQELYLLIGWDEAKELMVKEGFDDNSSLKSDSSPFPTYFVRKDWYDEINYKDYLDSLNTK